MVLQPSAAYIGAADFQNSVDTDRQIIQWLGSDFNRISAATDFAVSPIAGEHKVSVAPGRAFLRGINTIATQGSYFAWSDSATVVDMPVPQSNPFFATIILRVADPQYGTVTGAVGARYDVISGTPAATPAPASDATINALNVPGAWMRIADIRINTTDTGAIPAGQITSTRPAIQLSRASVICTSTTRPAHMVGLHIFETDTGKEYVSDGTNWRIVLIGSTASGDYVNWTDAEAWASTPVNYTVGTQGRYARAKRVDDVVFLDAHLRPDSGTNMGGTGNLGTIFRLPVIFRPTSIRRMTACRWVSGGSPAEIGDAGLAVGPDGNVSVGIPAAATSVFISGSYRI